MEDLWKLCLAIRQQAEHAEAKVVQANVLLQELRRNQAVGEAVVVGPVLFTRCYPPVPGGNDTGEVIQAVLSVDGGVGAAYWDSEVYAELSRIEEALDAMVKTAFTPFEECEPAVRAALLPHLNPMVAELWRRTRQARNTFRGGH